MQCTPNFFVLYHGKFNIPFIYFIRNFIIGRQKSESLSFLFALLTDFMREKKANLIQGLELEVLFH